MAADFDGDAENAISLKDLYLKKAYGKFDPRENMIVSKNDGLFDNNFNLIKDQLICFHQFNRLGNNKIEILKPPRNGEYDEKKFSQKKEKHKSKDNKQEKKMRTIRFKRI